MIQGYQKKQFIQKVLENCSLYKATKNDKDYFLYQYSSMNMCDQYNFKVLKKLITCSHVLSIIQKFQANDKTYFITQFVQSNLLKEQLKQPHQIFQLTKGLQMFAKIVQVIEELHQNSVIYRNFRLETLGFQHNQLFLSDFALSQVVKRKQRYFESVGLFYYLAPQFYLEDGYGFEVDIWAAGVCLFYMLTGSFPFNFQNKGELQMLQQMQKKCKKGFDFVANASQTKKAKYIQSSKSLEDLFKKLFQLDYTARITVQQLKSHPAIKQYFQNTKLNVDSQMMSVIQEQTYTHGSIFMSMLQDFESHHQFHKEQVILDFMEHSSQILMLDSPELISQDLRSIVNFSILKVALMKVTNLVDVLYGKKKPQFKISANEWQTMKNTIGFSKVKQKIQRKKKILEMLFRASFLNVQGYVKISSFYNDEIPQEFSILKSEYRNNLSKMFVIEKQIMRKQKNKQKVRKTCENLARLTILCMINRIFQDQNIKQNFKLYYEWSKKQSLQNLQEWIQNEKITNLKLFVINITSKYVQSN